MNKRMLSIAMMGSLALSATSLALQGAEIRVIAAAPLTAAVKALEAPFEKEAGHRVAAQFTSGPLVKRRIEAGEAFDVAISVVSVMDAMITEGKIDPATRMDVAYAGIGVGVRAGSPKPDISSVEAFKRALMNARSVTYDRDGIVGNYFAGLIPKLGIAEQMAGRLKPLPIETLYSAVPNGEAEMIVTTSSAVRKPGVEMVGLIPAELQFYNRFVAGLVTGSKEPEAAKRFIRFLGTPAAKAVITANDLVPGTPP